MINKLERAGWERAQAVSLAETMYEAMEESVATKWDLGQLESSLKLDIGKLESGLKLEIASVRTELANVRTEIEKAPSGTTRWLLGILLPTMVGIMLIQHFWR